MKIIQAFPPNIDQIIRKFKLEGFNPVFTYGEDLYNPSGLPIHQDLMVHEQTHERQQQDYGIEQWWAMYLDDPAFRLLQETEAYRAQYAFIKTVLNRKGRLGALNQLAENLASALYGNIINKKQAKDLIDG